MSEFGETASADVGKKLVGYTEKEPGRLYDFLEKNTEGAILYDEFEKTHKDMAKYMLQQIDGGLKELLMDDVISAEEAYMKASDKKLFVDYLE